MAKKNRKTVYVEEKNSGFSVVLSAVADFMLILVKRQSNLVIITTTALAVKPLLNIFFNQPGTGTQFF